MGSDWEKATVGEFCPFSYGKSLPERKRIKGNIPVVSSAGYCGRHNAAYVHTAGIVIGRKGTVGSITYCSQAFWPIDTAFYIADNPAKRDLRFTYYLLRTLGLSGMNSDSAVPGLNRDNAHVLRVLVPEISEQRAIAHILGSLDDKIELNGKMNETLEAMAQAIFKSWFVDFDPVIDNALAAGNPIPDALQDRAAVREALGDERKALPDDIRKLFPSEFELTEEMGWVPKGWMLLSVGNLIELAYGKALAAKVRVPGPYPVYGSGGIGGYHKEAFVKGPGIIVGRKGTVGSVYWEEGDFSPIDTVFFVKPKKSIPLYWLYQNLLQMDIASLGADSAVPGVNRNSIYAKSWVYPGENILRGYWRHIQPSVQKCQSQTRQTQTLRQLRDTLLPKLISGKLRIPDAEKLVEEAL